MSFDVFPKEVLSPAPFNGLHINSHLVVGGKPFDDVSNLFLLYFHMSWLMESEFVHQLEDM